jgi:hypothetical protein
MKVEPPYRQKRTYTQTLAATADEVFRLMCPVREEEWVPGWRPLMVLSNSGLVEEDCVFVTPGDPADAIWITTNHDPEAHKLRMYKVVPGMVVSRLDIAVADDVSGAKATISYEHTALSEAGRSIVNQHTQAAYRKFMKHWEAAVQTYLSTGEMIEA